MGDAQSCGSAVASSSRDACIAGATDAAYNGHLRPDGNAVAVTDRNGVAIWDLAPERLLDAACTLAGRNLTRSEWDTYLAGLGEYRPTCPDLA